MTRVRMIQRARAVTAPRSHVTSWTGWRKNSSAKTTCRARADVSWRWPWISPRRQSKFGFRTAGWNRSDAGWRSGWRACLPCACPGSPTQTAPPLATCTADSITFRGTIRWTVRCPGRTACICCTATRTSPDSIKVALCTGPPPACRTWATAQKLPGMMRIGDFCEQKRHLAKSQERMTTAPNRTRFHTESVHTCVLKAHNCQSSSEVNLQYYNDNGSVG